MTGSTSSKQSDKSQSMAEADTANGEAPDLEQNQTPAGPGLDDRPIEHPTGTRQAEENLENDPPA